MVFYLFSTFNRVIISTIGEGDVMIIKFVVPQGMCGGVASAINQIEKLLQDPQVVKPIYMLGSLVHNKIIVNQFQEQGIIILDGVNKEESINSIPFGTIIFTAHGVSDKIYDLALKKGLKIVDTTCPNVLKTHEIVKKKISEGYDILFFGIKGHPETEGILGLSNRIQLIDDSMKISPISKKTLLINQTTLPFKQVQTLYKKIKNKYPLIELADEICSATYQRQKAALEQTKDADICLVVGDIMSNNCQSLKQVIESENNVKTYLIETVNDLKSIDFSNVNTVALTSGASTPKTIVDAIINELEKYK